MKKQGYKARLSESLGERHKGKHKQSMKAREHESEAMEESHEYGADKSMEHMSHHDHMKEAMKHIRHAHKKAPKHDGHKAKRHVSAHDKAVDRKNLAKARKAK